MDISALIVNETAEIVVKDTAGQPTDLVIEVYGMDSARARRIALEASRNPIPDDISDEERDGKDAEFVAKMTKGWRNAMLNGEPLEPTEGNFAKVYKLSSFIRSQVWIEINRRANFLPKA